MVHQVSSDVIANALEHGGGHERVGNDRPGIVEVRWDKALEVDGLVDLWNCEEDDILRARRGIQYTVEDGLQQNEPERFQKTDASQQKHPGQELQQEWKDVADEARQLPHRAPARSRPQLLAAGRMDMRCKALFYLSPMPEEWRFSVWVAATLDCPGAQP